MFRLHMLFNFLQTICAESFDWNNFRLLLLDFRDGEICQVFVGQLYSWLFEWRGLVLQDLQQKDAM